MSFKHVKFEDSPIMRSLERVAQEKGLIKQQPPLQKTAALSKKADLTPTPNLMENIFKLCAGLREQGRVVEATEVETNYLHYKQAQTLYEAHKEKGEDLVHAAHPKGSHKLEGVEGDEATFEDILDRHTKILQVIEKKPTGKLSNASQVLHSVRVVLGQQNVEAQRNALLEKAKASIRWIERKSNDELTFSISGAANEIVSLLNKPSVYNLNAAKNFAKQISKRLDPSFLTGSSHGMGGLSDYTWGKVNVELQNFISLVDDAVGYQQKIDDTEDAARGGHANPPAMSRGPVEPAPAAGPDTIGQQFVALSDKIELYTARAQSMGAPNSAAIVAWLGRAAEMVKKYSEAYANNKFKSDPKVTQNYAAKLNDIQTKVEALAQKYIK